MRPNVLIFMVDQQRFDALGTFGNPVVQTPNIDALAARGVRFDQAWSQHSVCGPSRASFMTGWYPHVAGHRTLTNLLGHHEPNLLKLLRDGGYKTAMAGSRGDVFAPGVTEASTDMCGFIIQPSGGFVDGLTLAYPEGHRMHSAFYFGKQGDEPRLDIDEAAVQTAQAWIEAGGSEPWALWVPLINPHPPFMVEEPWFSMHDRADVPLPLPISAAAGKAAFMDEMRRRYGWSDLDEADYREIVATYYGMVSRTDEQLGRLLDTIDRRGQLDNTVVIYLSDHGEYLGDYALIEKWPSGLDPVLVKNPMIIAGPGVVEGGVCKSQVELIDVLPTLLELGDIEPSHTHFGKSLMGVMADPTVQHREFSFCEGGFNPTDADLFESAGWIYKHKADIQKEHPELVAKAHAVRNATHTYVYRQAEGDELYDRIADPYETTNLIADQSLAAVCEHLRGELLDWLVRTSDVIPWDTHPRNPKIPHGWRSSQV